nr:unnamed protein product [Callosobruchus analis]
MTPQLLVPNPKNTRLLYCKSELKFDFGLFRLVHRWGF